MIELKLAKNLFINCSRIGYGDEGIRLTIFEDIPYNFHVELQLSKSDTKQLIELLTQSLKSETSRGLK